MTNTKSVLQIFSREPVPGNTKTRLIPSLGKQGAADLHKKLLKQIIEAACESQFSNIELWGTSDPDQSLLQEYMQQYHLRLCKQSGDDVGERMYHSSKEALDHYEFVVIIGSDCPLLTSQVLNKAYRMLKQGTDAVLGPTEDGGYYLIGLRRNNISIFKDIPWGEADVADMTRTKMRSLGWGWKELEYLWDVDRPADYERLKEIEFFYSSVSKLA
jgi:rSAM/selenodomain-associated transferase 1